MGAFFPLLFDHTVGSFISCTAVLAKEKKGGREEESGQRGFPAFKYFIEREARQKAHTGADLRIGAFSHLVIFPLLKHFHFVECLRSFEFCFCFLTPRGLN